MRNATRSFLIIEISVFNGLFQSLFGKNENKKFVYVKPSVNNVNEVFLYFTVTYSVKLVFLSNCFRVGMSGFLVTES